MVRIFFIIIYSQKENLSSYTYQVFETLQLSRKSLSHLIISLEILQKKKAALVSQVNEY